MGFILLFSSHHFFIRYVDKVDGQALDQGIRRYDLVDAVGPMECDPSERFSHPAPWMSTQGKSVTDVITMVQSLPRPVMLRIVRRKEPTLESASAALAAAIIVACCSLDSVYRCSCGRGDIVRFQIGQRHW